MRRTPCHSGYTFDQQLPHLNHLNRALKHVRGLIFLHTIAYFRVSRVCLGITTLPINFLVNDANLYTQTEHMRSNLAFIILHKDTSTRLDNPSFVLMHGLQTWTLQIR